MSRTRRELWPDDAFREVADLVDHGATLKSARKVCGVSVAFFTSRCVEVMGLDWWTAATFMARIKASRTVKARTLSSRMKRPQKPCYRFRIAGVCATYRWCVCPAKRKGKRCPVIVYMARPSARARAKAKYASDPEHREMKLLRTRQWNKQHPDRYRASTRLAWKRWVKKHPHEYRLIARSRNRARDAKIRDQRKDGDAVIARAIMKAPDFCFYCGVPLHGRYEVDHVVPLSKGGAHAAFNLVKSCSSCNQSKGDKHVNEWKRGQALLTF